MKHCARIICKVPFSFKVEGQRGPRINVKLGDEFWNTTPEYEQKRTGIVKIARKGKNMGYAYPFTIEIANQYFEVIE